MADAGTSQEKYGFKVVLLGEGCVGKTSLVLRYCQNVFNDRHITTLQASFLTKRLNLGGKRVDLNIWDTAGQERFHALGPIYYRDADGALLVYDITDVDSFNRVKNWVKELRKMLGSEIPIIIAGNKADLEKTRTVAIEEAQSYAQSVNASYVETSAKLNKGVDQLFLDLTKAMIAARQKQATEAGSSGDARKRGSRRSLVVVEDEPPAKSSGGGCCGGSSSS